MCDVDTEEALTPEEAANDIFFTAENPLACPGGSFYRARQVIPW